MFRHPFNPRTLMAMCHDLFWIVVLWVGLFGLRASPAAGWPSVPPEAWQTLALVAPIQFGTFLAFGLYRGLWRYASLHDLRRIALAVGVASLLVPFAILLWRHAIGIPRSILVLDPLLLVALMAGGRISYRWLSELPFAGLRSQGKPVLLLSSHDVAIASVQAFNRSAKWQLVGILDEQPGRVGRTVAGVRVVGTWDQLHQVAPSLGAAHAVLSDVDLSHVERRRVFEMCEQAGVKLMLVPAVDDLLSGRVRVTEVREIELDDLLGRDPVALEAGALGSMLAGKIVMVTGAGGSIGAELCRQIARFSPGQLLLYELNEFALYEIEQEFRQKFPSVPIRCLIGDVKDAGRLHQVFARFRPNVLFHAAAYKHVPMMESDNAWAAVQNNVLGTLRLAQVIERHRVERFVFISTDKAVNPTSVMGATKRLSEILLQRWAQRTQVPTVIVRFGNVLGSAGSVVPKFREQIAAGGPVTVTHPEMKRYFMSIPEASQLVLQSALMGRSGEIFVLDMGEPVRIVDLARDLIRLSGYGEGEIRIDFTGLRPGEKLYEELLADSESTLPTRHAKIRVSRPIELPDSRWEKEALAWLLESPALEDSQVRRGLAHLIPEYRPFRERVGTAENVIEFPHSRIA